MEEKELGVVNIENTKLVQFYVLSKTNDKTSIKTTNQKYQELTPNLSRHHLFIT